MRTLPKLVKVVPLQGAMPYLLYLKWDSTEGERYAIIAVSGVLTCISLRMKKVPELNLVNFRFPC